MKIKTPFSTPDALSSTKLRPLHWRDIYDPKTGRLLHCRPFGAPAGQWPHTPWWHCVFHDPYERINFWTHAIPGLAFLCLGIVNALLPQQAMALFSLCAAATHCFSALTHVYPDSHSIEKLDHIGITATIIGTPISSLMAQEHGHLPFELKLISLWLVGAAFLKPTPRVVGFVVGATAMVVLYGSMLLSYVFAIELALYLGGALFFLRNDGHERGIGLSDHHILHYFVTVASVLHLWYLQQQQ